MAPLGAGAPDHQSSDVAAAESQGRHAEVGPAQHAILHRVSPVYLEVPGRPAFDAGDATAIATIIDGARTWVESIAPIAANADRRRLIGYFDAARAQLEALAR